MSLYHPADARQFDGGEAYISGQFDGMKPKLAAGRITVDVNVWRLIRLMSVEIQAIGPFTQNRRH